jgi:hypothetical protein
MRLVLAKASQPSQREGFRLVDVHAKSPMPWRTILRTFGHDTALLGVEAMCITDSAPKFRASGIQTRVSSSIPH